jgi:NADH-quinone oxidoreductase subunit J
VTLNLILLIGLIVTSLWAVMTRSLLMSAIALAITSITLTALMFALDAPLAAVFELSVCAGLITVVFMTTISLTKPVTRVELKQQTKNRIKRYWYLPVIVVALFIVLGYYMITPEPKFFGSYPELDVRNVLWKLRQTDMLGQMILILTGVFGIVVLFKEGFSHDHK